MMAIFGAKYTFTDIASIFTRKMKEVGVLMERLLTETKGNITLTQTRVLAVQSQLTTSNKLPIPVGEVEKPFRQSIGCHWS